MENNVELAFLEGLTPKVKWWILNDESLLKMAKRVYRKTMSLNSVTTYVKNVVLFSKFLGVSKPVEALKMNLDWEAILNEWIDELIANDNAPKTVRTRIASVKRWLKVNLSKEEWLKIDWREIELPTGWNVESDRIPLKENLREVALHADEKGKAIITLAVSSGLRQSTIAQLKVKHIKILRKDKLIPLQEVLEKNLPLQRDDLGLILIPPEITKERTRKYLTFCSNEALKYLTSYLRKRMKNGEKITDETPLIKSRITKGHLKKIRAIAETWNKLLALTGLDHKSRKWRQLRFHSLRKYFSTWLRLSGVNTDIAEFFLGHRQGVKSVYNLFGDIENPAVISRLAAEYMKAQTALTIFTEEQQIRELERRFQEEIRRKDEQIRQLEKEIRELREIISNLDLKALKEFIAKNKTKNNYIW